MEAVSSKAASLRRAAYRRPEEITRAITRALREFSGEMEAADDRTLLGGQKTGRAVLMAGTPRDVTPCSSAPGRDAAAGGCPIAQPRV